MMQHSRPKALASIHCLSMQCSEHADSHIHLPYIHRIPAAVAVCYHTYRLEVPVDHLVDLDKRCVLIKRKGMFAGEKYINTSPVTVLECTRETQNRTPDSELLGQASGASTNRQPPSPPACEF